MGTFRSTGVVLKGLESFSSETARLLDIVTNSIYTDSEVFVRELVSNGCDGLEKGARASVVKAEQVLRKGGVQGITITTSEDCLIIEDGGVGMTEEELRDNLGTIARSGTLKATQEGAEDLIGKFGLGFYSCFMVSKKVEVHSKSAFTEDAGNTWTSDGGGHFELTQGCDEDLVRGCRVKMFLKDDHKNKWGKDKMMETVKKYSNFVNFPIHIDGELANTVSAIWATEPKDVDDEAHKSFYNFISGGDMSTPMHRIHYRADAPLSIQALLYVPEYHTEKYGMGRMSPSVQLYSRKVLVEGKAEILPDWLRFLKGVIDCEDLPLSVSREKPQDARLMAKLKSSTTRKVLADLTKLAKKEPEKYKDTFWKEYAHFIKEGVCQDYEFQSVLSKLLYFDSSRMSKDGEITSLEEYISRCPPEQKDIYYIQAPSRELALSSPYMEAFASSSGPEVLFIYSDMDDFVMNNLKSFEGRSVKSVESKDLDAGLDKSEEGSDKEGDGEGKKGEGENEAMPEKDSADLCAWLETTLSSSKVSKVKTTTRLAQSPAIIVDHESASLRRVMRSVDTSSGLGGMPLSPQTLLINVSHPLIKSLHESKGSPYAKSIADQLFDNALVQAGLLDDPRGMVPRLNEIMLKALMSSSSQGGKGAEGGDDKDDKDDKDDGDKKEEDADAGADATGGESKA